MQTEELFYPQVVARLGPYTFDRGIVVETYSAKQRTCDWAKVRFTEDIYQPKISLSRMDSAVLSFGYGNVLDDTFIGYVARPYNAGGFADEIVLKDEMIWLETAKVNGTFQDTTPQEIVSYLLESAGISAYSLAADPYPAKKRFSVRQSTVVQAIRQMHAAWGISQPFFFSDGVFYWGTKPVQSKVYVFEYGANILTLTRSAGVWELETVSAPFVRHSQTIRVEHPKVRGEFEVLAVRMITNDDGFIRTYISFA